MEEKNLNLRGKKNLLFSAAEEFSFRHTLISWKTFTRGHLISSRCAAVGTQFETTSVESFFQLFSLFPRSGHTVSVRKFCKSFISHLTYERHSEKWSKYFQIDVLSKNSCSTYCSTFRHKYVRAPISPVLANTTFHTISKLYLLPHVLFSYIS